MVDVDADQRVCIQDDREIEQELKKMLLPAVDPNPERRYPSVQELLPLADYLERIWPGRSW